MSEFQYDVDKAETRPALPPDADANLALALAAAAKSRSTLETYAAGWRQYEKWGVGKKISATSLRSPDTIAAYLANLVRNAKSLSTIQVALASIRHHYESVGHPVDDPDKTLRTLLQGISRRLGTAPEAPARPATPDILSALVEAAGDRITPRSIRDVAILLVGFFGALRRSELAALRVVDVEFVPNGIVIRLPRSKADQQGRGQTVAIHSADEAPDLCAVRALRAWLDIRENMLEFATFPSAVTSKFPIFCGVDRYEQPFPGGLTTKTIERIVKKAAAQSGFDPSGLTPHSLRSGLATTAAMNGEDIATIMRHTRHVSVESALRYIRPAKVWDDNLTRGLLDKASRSVGDGSSS